METSEKLHNLRHSLAHLMAAAVIEMYPDTKATIGPVIEDGFYYDFEFKSPISDKDLPKIEKKMREILKTWKEFTHEEKTQKEALKYFENNEYKTELINEIENKDEKITFYTCGNFTDLCRGGHVENPSKEIKPDSFKLDRVAGAYWRGDEKNKMLTRIYGLAFETKEELENYLKLREEAEKRDHRKLGKDLGLFIFSDVIGKGLPLWTEKGTIIRRELERFIVDEEIKRGYKHVCTPDIAKIELYKKSGHYPYYKDSMYAPIKIDEEEFMLRPMACPHHFELYLNKPHSYKELPIRIAELAKLYRYEQSGELTGLMRVRSFCLADAHIICTGPKQAGEEVNSALDLIEYIANVFGLKMGQNYGYRLSLGDRTNSEKYYKNDKAWDEAEAILRQVLKERKASFVEAPAEAAFYGPKIDIQMKNIRGKEETAFTVQYDFVMPERFNLNYIDKEGNEKRTIVVHRSSIGAIERVMAFLIEHYAGAFPLWLSPVQAKVLPISTDKHLEFAGTVSKLLKDAGIRVELDESNESLGKKIRDAKMQKIPYLVVIGDKEKESNTMTVEGRNNEKLEGITPADFLAKLKKEIEDKK
ncbi:threonine--tRNA ligase [Patescibacteria group bacterium]|nr:threonine--tRNA ligase [Patescibacteria group bacterium]MBU1728087.1 threonine--tRNA ligase [Patescibacteria group bacterium]